MRHALPMLALLTAPTTLALPARGAPVPFAVDTEASSASLSATATVLGQSRSDSEDSSVTGSGEFEIVQTDGVSVSLHDLDLAMDPVLTLTFTWMLGPLGTFSVDVSAEGVTVGFAGTEPSAFAAVDAETGAFVIPDQLFSATGLLIPTFNGSPLDVVDLSTYGAQEADVTGTLAIAGGEATLTLETTFSGTQTFQAGVIGGTVEFTAAATAVLRGTLEEPCLADRDGDGAVAVNDLIAFLSAFGAKDQAADIDADGDVDVQDLITFLTAFGGGC